MLPSQGTHLQVLWYLAALHLIARKQLLAYHYNKN